MVFCGVDMGAALKRLNRYNVTSEEGDASTLHHFNSLTTIHPGNKIGEERFVTVTALGVILDRERKGKIAQPLLFDDVVGLAPGLDFETVPEPIDGLVMGAVHAVEAMRRRAFG